MKSPNVEMTRRNRNLAPENIFLDEDVQNNKVSSSSSLRAFENW